MRPTVTSSLLHLSDLHLGQDFYDVGSINKSDGVNLQSAAAVVKNQFRIVMQSHDDYILTSLPTDIRKAAAHLGVAEKQFDFHVVTGDISTTATSDERFSFARDYLIGQIEVRDSNSGHSLNVGLNLGKDKVLCIPGNHDKMDRANLNEYLSGFSDLPARPNYVIEKTSRQGQRLIFFALDSNLYQEGNEAVGKISAVALGWLKDQFRKYDQLDIAETNAVRILLLHHHPADLNPFRSRSLMHYIPYLKTQPLTRLEGGDRLLEACAGNIDVIMHGHEHFPIVFYNEDAECLIVSAGTAAKIQFDSKRKNSFHALAFYDRKFRVVQFNWSKGRFAAEYEWTGDLDQAGCALRGQKLVR